MEIFLQIGAALFFAIVFLLLGTFIIKKKIAIKSDRTRKILGIVCICLGVISLIIFIVLTIILILFAGALLGFLNDLAGRNSG